MPIAYACPHCGKQFAVAEEYAGQSGRCAGCGKPIAVPMAMGSAMNQQAQRASAGGGGCAIATVVSLVVMLMCGGILAALVWPAIQSARMSARRAQSQNKLHQIGIALHNYADTYGVLPPAIVADANGKPLYSGRVLLLPFRGEQATFDSFDKDQAWDSPKNVAISERTMSVFRETGSSPAVAGQTDYLFVTGAGTVFQALQPGRAMRLTDIRDGLSNTMAVVEVKDSGVNWAEPRDLDISHPMALPPGNDPGGNNVLVCDASVQFVPKTAQPKRIREWATRNGKEPANHF
jgi:hypothetical protein